MAEFLVPAESDGQRLDAFLAGVLPDLSRSKIQRFIEQGHASTNAIPIKLAKKPVRAGESIRFIEPDTTPLFPPPEKYALTIIHEDDDILVIDKPVGMVTHPNSFEETGTLVQAVLAHYPAVKEALYDTESEVSRLRPGIVHRLDKDTSGLMVVTKNRVALLNLAAQFHTHAVEKEYETTLYGVLETDRTVDAPIRRKGSRSKNVMGASHDPEEGRQAITHFHPIRSYAPYEKWPEEKVTQVRAKIETGRTHQIRVHAKFIGHPVMGDALYGNKPSARLSEKLGLTTQVLRSVRLAFTHPTTGKRLEFSV